jgi:phage portal protein BeeE
VGIVRSRLAAATSGRGQAVGPILSQIISQWQANRPIAVEGDRRSRGRQYQRSSLINSLVTARARAVSQARLTVTKKGREVGAEDILGSIAARPNKKMVPSKLGFRTERDIWTHGEFIAQKRRSAALITREIHPLRVDRMECVPASDGSVSHWEQWLDGRKVGADIEPDDIVHIPLDNPLHDYRGLAPPFVLHLEAQLDDDGKLFLSELLRNGGIPAAIMSMPPGPNGEGIDEEEAKRNQKRWSEMYGRRYGVPGGTGFGEIAVLGGGATVSKFGLDPSGMDLSNLTRISESRAVAVYGWSALLLNLTVGSEHSAAYGFLDDSAWWVWFNTVIPELVWLEQEWTAQLASEFGPEYAFKYDLSEVPALIGARSGAMTNAVMLFRNLIIPRREALKMCGLPDIDRGEDVWADKLGLVAPPAPTGQGGTGVKASAVERPRLSLSAHEEAA